MTAEGGVGGRPARQLETGEPGDKRARVINACEHVARIVESDERYRHTAALTVTVDGDHVFDRTFAGLGTADTFSITKTVVALLVGIAVERGELTDLDAPISESLPRRSDSLTRQTWRHLLTMTRGASVGGVWDIDHVMTLEQDWVGHIARAPQMLSPGSRFAYDNGAAHLLAAALIEVCGTPLEDYAERHLFAPLGVGPEEWEWPTDPDGIALGFGHLRLTVNSLELIGQLILQEGRWGGRQLVDHRYMKQMLRPASSGGPPEGLPYGHLIWVDEGVGALAAGWAGQALLVMPRAKAVVVATGDPGFRFGPPPSDSLPPDWLAALQLVRRHIVPVLLAH